MKASKGLEFTVDCEARGSLAEDAFKGSLGSQSFLRASEV